MAENRVTWRSVILALILLVASNWLMRSSEFVMGRYITSGVPPVSAVGGLLILLLANQLLRGRLARYRLTRAELLVAYAGLCLGTAATHSYGVRAIFPYFSSLRYFGDATNHFADLADGLPGWYALNNNAAVQGLYEGLPGKGVPWGAWRGILVGWGSFLLILFFGVACLCALVRRPWMDHERLMFPVTQLPLALTQPNLKLPITPVFWLGFLVAALVNASNIGHAFVDSLPAFQPSYPVPEGAFAARPWTPLRSMTFFNRPELYGFAYWVPNEILLSGWLSYVLIKLCAVGGMAAGLDQPGYPFLQEQSTGGYLAMAILLVWALRRQLKQAFGSVVGKPADDAQEPMSYRVAILGLFGAILYCAWFLTTGGVPRLLALIYMVVIYVFVLVYTRLRVEAGLALEFIYPYSYPRKLLLYSLGPDTFIMGGGGTQGLVAYYVAGFMARFHAPMWASSFTLEGLRLAEAAEVKQRQMMRWLYAILVIGVVLAAANYLTYNYEHGLNYFEGNGGNADWRTRAVVQEYNELSNFVLNPQGPETVRLGYLVGGFVTTFLLAAGRLAWLGFPLHPVGYLLATAYGDTSPMWWPFLVIWLLKTGLLKYGGLKTYRKLLPFFVGFIVGHYLIGGLGWSLLSTYATPDIAHRYYTIFG